nr:10664_t:CDS:2 [Entrophospora candida]
MPKLADLPLIFEELKLKEEDKTLTLQELIAQFKQQIPLDIPHSLLEKLNLKKGVDLPTNFYLAPHLLKKDQETTQGGITLQEGEIILLNPHKLLMKDQEVQTEPNLEEEEKLRNQLAKKDKEIADLKAERNDLKSFQDLAEILCAEARLDAFRKAGGLGSKHPFIVDLYDLLLAYKNIKSDVDIVNKALIFNSKSSVTYATEQELKQISNNVMLISDDNGILKHHLSLLFNEFRKEKF